MARTEQTKLSDFIEKEEERSHTAESDSEPTSVLTLITPPPRPKGQMWYKTIGHGEKWGVCNFDGTILLVQFENDKMYAHGEEMVCKWCGGVLEIRDERVFCGSACKRYQGEFSDDPNSFLHWDGVKSYTLRRMVAEIDDLELEPRDLEPIPYVPDWSILYEYADDMERDDDDDSFSKE